MLCYTLSFPVVMCAPDETLAAAQCFDGGGSSYVTLPLCPPGSSETSGSGGDPWGSGLNIEFNLRTGEFKLNPSPLLQDSSLVVLDESGYYRVEENGELSDVLGWQVGDLLLSLNGYPLRGREDVSVAYTELGERSAFTLFVERRGARVELRYRVE